MLGISRGKAYEWARRYLETNGSEGMPVVAFGRCFRVPRAGLEQMLGGELHWTREPKEAPAVAAAPAPPEPRPASSTRPRRRRRPANDAQLNLFDLLPPSPPTNPR